MADLPHAVHLHLADALLAWAPRVGEHLFATEPEAAVDADLRQVLDGCGGGSMRSCGGGWADRVVLNEVRGPIRLALQALRAPAPGLREPRSPAG